MRTSVEWLWGRRFAVAYVAIAAWFVLRVLQVHDAHTGLTPMIVFGDVFASLRLSRLRDVPIYTYRDSDGYDGQFYAQIAVAGNPFDPELRTALDSPAYRTRRVLIPMLAHIAGLGRPRWVLQAYALSNLACWLFLAWALARWWFPPDSEHNLLRWAGTLLGAGVVMSVSRSLTDLPALVFITVGVRCLETNRQWLGAGILAAAGLVRETSVMAAATLFPPTRPGTGAWRRGLLAASVCALPAVVWIVVLSVHHGTLSRGAIAIDLPLVAIWRKVRQIHEARNLSRLRDDIFVLIAVLVQVAFVLGRPRPSLPWWRIGFVFSLLALVIWWPSWEDAVGGVPRTVTPLALAFNILAPRTRRGLVLLLAGNLTILSASTLVHPVPTEQTTFVDGLTCDYAAGWHKPEHAGTRTWRWASGPATMKLENPNPTALVVRLDFDMISETDRTVELRAGALRDSLTLQAHRRTTGHFGPFTLPPGQTSLTFDSPQPAWFESAASRRGLTFSLQNFFLTVVGGGPSNEK